MGMDYAHASLAFSRAACCLGDVSMASAAGRQIGLAEPNGKQNQRELPRGHGECQLLTLVFSADMRRNSRVSRMFSSFR